MSKFNGALVFEKQAAKEIREKLVDLCETKIATRNGLQERIDLLRSSLNEEHEKWQSSWGITCNWFTKIFIAPACPYKLSHDYGANCFNLNDIFADGCVSALYNLRRR